MPSYKGRQKKKKVLKVVFKQSIHSTEHIKCVITDVGSKSDPRTGQGTSTGRTALDLRKVLAMPGGKERWQGKSKECRREEHGEEEGALPLH